MKEKFDRGDNLASSEAVRHIVCALSSIDEGLASTASVLRQAIFYVWEGGEANKWSIDRPYSSAARQLRSSGIDRRLLRYDHSIPLATIRSRLLEAKDDPAAFRCVLVRFVRPAIIVKSEDDLLAKKYRRSMPNGSLPDDAMARYRAAKIIFDAEDEAKLLVG